MTISTNVHQIASMKAEGEGESGFYWLRITTERGGTVTLHMPEDVCAAVAAAYATATQDAIKMDATP